MKNLHKILTAVLLTLMSNTVFATNITSTVDRSPVAVDESFKLILKADGDVDDKPNLNALNRNFTILDVSNSTSVNIINGRYSKSLIWTIVLQAKRHGVLTIPSIAFGSDTSPALRVSINKASTTASLDRNFYIEVTTDIKNTWVQSQILYTVKILRNINLDNLNWSDISTSDANAIVKQLGKHTTYETARNGVRHLVTEIRYSIFPQTSGKLIINPIIAEGYTRKRSRSFFDQFTQRGDKKRARSKASYVSIKAKPKTIPSNEWLPASKVALSETWSGKLDDLKVGEPITRTITLTANGLLAAQVPDITIPDVNKIKQYPDQALNEDNVNQTGVIGTKTFKVALIATDNGQYKLPAISIPWWNTRTGRTSYATLPEQILNASGGVAQQPLTPVAPAASPPLNASASEITPITTENSYWHWISLALAIGWIVTVIFIVIYPRYQKNIQLKHYTQSQSDNLRKLKKEVIVQCKNNDMLKTKDALLKWAKSQWPQHAPCNLADIKKLCPENLAAEIQVLNDTLYSKNQSTWQSAALQKTLAEFNAVRTTQHNTNQTPLEPLYKI